METTIFVHVQEGRWHLDDVYVPAVVAAEIGAAPMPAMKAQAIAARTFVLRAMRDDPKLGTAEKPIPNGESFQVYDAKGKAGKEANDRALIASWATAGMVMRWNGQLIIANYVAGARWTGKAVLGDDYSSTEKWVTYNEGKRGAHVKPTSLSLPSRTDNRGCMSQNGASWLAKNGYTHDAILRFFYGADIEVGPIVQLAPTPIGPTPPAPTAQPAAPVTRTSAAPLLAFAGLAALALET